MFFILKKKRTVIFYRDFEIKYIFFEISQNYFYLSGLIFFKRENTYFQCAENQLNASNVNTFFHDMICRKLFLISSEKCNHIINPVKGGLHFIYFHLHLGWYGTSANINVD